LNNKKCHLYQIGGVEDHIHIIVDVHPTNSISDLIKDIKLSSTEFIKSNLIYSAPQEVLLLTFLCKLKRKKYNLYKNIAKF